MPSKTCLDLEGDGALRSLACTTTGQVDNNNNALTLELGAQQQQQHVDVKKGHDVVIGFIIEAQMTSHDFCVFLPNQELFTYLQAGSYPSSQAWP
jgi:hypothetical protein